MTHCKLSIYTIFNTRSSADERTEVAEFVSPFLDLHSRLLHSCLQKVSKITIYFLKGKNVFSFLKGKKIVFLLKGKKFVLVSAGAKYKAARTQTLELKSLQFSRN